MIMLHEAATIQLQHFPRPSSTEFGLHTLSCLTSPFRYWLPFAQPPSISSLRPPEPDPNGVGKSCVPSVDPSTDGDSHGPYWTCISAYSSRGVKSQFALTPENVGKASTDDVAAHLRASITTHGLIENRSVYIPVGMRLTALQKRASTAISSPSRVANY